MGEHGLDVAPARHREQLDVVRQQAAQRDPLAGGQEPAGCLLGVQADVGAEVQPAADGDAPHEGLAVVRDDPEVVSGGVADVLGQREFDVAHRVGGGRAVERGGQLAAGAHAHRPGPEGLDERALPVPGYVLDAVPGGRRFGCGGAEVDLERLGEGRPQPGSPLLELAVEVSGRVALAPGVQAARTERGHLLVDELRELLERGGPLAVAAAEHDVGHAGQVRMVFGEPPREADGVVGGCAVVGGGDDGDRPVAWQIIDVVVQGGDICAEPQLGCPCGDLFGGFFGRAEVRAVQGQQGRAVAGAGRLLRR